MTAMLAGIGAVAGLTVREAWRARLWALFAAVALLLVVAVPRLHAVDAGARLKLAVVVITSGIGFVVVLLAIMVGANGLRRDLEQRTAYLLFSKPLSHAAYLLGRWLGVQLGLLAGIAALSVVGLAVIASDFSGVPTMRRVIVPAGWQQVSAAGEVLAIDERRAKMVLGGPAGNGLRWRFGGLPTGLGANQSLELLLRARVSGYQPDLLEDRALIEVAALPASGAAIALALDPASPYGRGDGRELPPGRMVLVDHDDSRSDLGADYLRLRLPGSAIGADGVATVQIVRLETRSLISFSRGDALKVSLTSESFLANLLRGGLVLLASAGLLGGCALMCAAISNLGVSLLGGLTLFFAGNALPAINDLLGNGDLALPLRRVLELAGWVLPDFGRFEVAAQLAAGQTVEWAVVGAAWGYYGAYAAIFLALAWVALRRKEL